MTVLAGVPKAFLHFDMGENKAFRRQKYKAYTGKHGIQRTGQEKLFYADLLACITYVSEYNQTPDFVIVAGGAPGVHFTRLVSMFLTKRLPPPGQLTFCCVKVKAENA
jgi:hypothetical protein